MVSLTQQLQDFIRCHADDDTAGLLLAAHRYPGIDVAWAVEQIEARRRLKSKLPEWYANERLVMSGRVPAEQCSSELAARYKRTLVDGAQSLCDMTGGMGVDLYYMSEGMSHVVYTERQAELCEAAKHNFSELGRSVEVRHGDGREMEIPDVDVIYLDPARRSADGGRVYAVEDCEPNVLEWQEELMEHCATLVVKLSPMVDITDLLRKMRHVAEVHIVAVRNECKEVLVKCSRQASGDVTLHCVDFLATGTMRYSFQVGDGRIEVIDDDHTLLYIYDPDVTLVKCQAYASLCARCGVKQLDSATRLFTASSLIEDFPGRTFIVDELIPFTSKDLKKLCQRIPQANIATRNFPLTADELRKRTKIKDGGDIYLFATTIRGKEKSLLKCHKA